MTMDNHMREMVIPHETPRNCVIDILVREKMYRKHKNESVHHEILTIFFQEIAQFVIACFGKISKYHTVMECMLQESFTNNTE